MDRPDLVGNQLLQPPQIAVADAEFLEVADGVVEIFRARADMAAGSGKHPRHRVQRLPERGSPARHPDPEAERPYPALLGAHGNPPDRADTLMVVDLAPQQSFDLLRLVAV